MIVIERAAAEDLPSVLALLEHNRLLIEGVAEHLSTMLVARQDGRVVGVAAIELYAEGALLRSVAVDPALHGRGTGHALTDAALRLAEGAGATCVFLLTTTAEKFFPRFGFESITREDVPASVRSSVEFTSACCASAVVMRRHLDVGA